MPIGIPAAGKRNIERLLPEGITTAVYAANPSLVQAATAGTKEEQDSAKSSLEKLLLAEFKTKATRTPEYFDHFYQ